MEKISRIYVAGDTGLVGSAIVRNLKKKGYTNFVFSPWPQYDLINQQVVMDFFAKEKPEYVFMAAAKVGGIVANNTYRAQFIYENIQMQNNIIHQCYVQQVKKLLFLGSSCIYPASCPQPMKEDYLLTGELEYTNEPYAIAKIAGIKLCESYNIQYNTNFISVMPTNLYGPHDNFDLEKSHVLPAMIRKMHLGKCLMNQDFESIRQDLTKRPLEDVTGQSSKESILAVLNKFGVRQKASIELWGTGTPRREFLHSDDLANACVFLMERVDFINLSERKGKEIKNTHINIGTGVDQTISELALLVKKIVGYQGELLWNTDKPDGTRQKLLDVTKLHALGWKEKIKLEEGISNVYADYIS